MADISGLGKQPTHDVTTTTTGAWLLVQGSKLGPADVMAAVSLAQSAAQPVADALAGVACTAPQPAEPADAPGVDPAALATMSRLMQVHQPT